ncbi:hypothetical protein M3J09_009703 [Ascochyta lentis]
MLFRLLAASIFIGFALAQKICSCCTGTDFRRGKFIGYWHTNLGVGYCRLPIGGGADGLGCSNLCNR